MALFPPAPPHPELDALLEAIRGHVMSAEERRAQSISWTFGNLSADGVNITRESIVRLHDELHGPAPIVHNPDLAFVRSELQRVRGILDGIARRLDELAR